MTASQRKRQLILSPNSLRINRASIRPRPPSPKATARRKRCIREDPAGGICEKPANISRVFPVMIENAGKAAARFP